MTALAIPNPNLMPAARIAASHRRRRIRAWMVGIALYIPVVLGVWGYWAVQSAQAGGVTHELAEAGVRVDKLKREVAASEVRLAAARRELEAGREVRNHPDMSVLVSRIASATGSMITLDRLEIRPVRVDEKNKKSDLAAPSGYTLRLTGLSSDQVDVPRFGRALQDLGIFETISVVGIRAKEAPIKLNSKGEQVRSTQLYAFEIDGVFSDSGAAPSRPSGGAK